MGKRHQPLVQRSGSTSFSSYPVPHSNVRVLAAASGSKTEKSLNLNTVHDLIYLANVTVAGQQYPIQLDTGSSDLWVKGPSSPLPGANQTSIAYNVTYGIGWAYGHVSYADVTFAGLQAKDQAFLDVSSAQNPALLYGAVGILGLGFTSLSTVDALVNKSGASTGRSLLYNLFEDNPSEPNFIAFSLQRSTQEGDQVEGSFSIGEYHPAYADTADKPAIPTWPVTSPKRWNVLLDAVLIGNQTVIPTTVVPNAPANKAVVLLDSGTSFTYAPKAICDAIYSGINGAKYDSASEQWIVPCDVEIDMALQIGGQLFPVHPLDVTPVGLANDKTCVGSFVPQAVSVGGGEFDWLIGDNVLRSVYSVYDFGDFDSDGKMGNPYVRLRSLIDPNQASVEFHKTRGGTPNTNISYTPINSANEESSSTSVTLSTQLAKTLDTIGKYFPAMLGVMALNGLVMLGLLVLGIVYLCRRRRRSRGAPSRTPRGRLTPMPVRTDDSVSRSSFMPPSPTRPHVYEPVSMALTEDTMMVPSPGFKVFDGEVIRPADRPMSMMPSQSYQGSPGAASAGAIQDDNALFVPPSPAFRDRPRSVA